MPSKNRSGRAERPERGRGRAEPGQHVRPYSTAVTPRCYSVQGSRKSWSTPGNSPMLNVNETAVSNSVRAFMLQDSQCHRVRLGDGLQHETS